MSRQRISADLRAAVRARAHDRCEYCRVPEIAVFFGHEPDHVFSDQDREELRRKLWLTGHLPA